MSQSTEQRQANRNRIIDQSQDSNALMQLNWASFGSGVSSVCIIITLSILLFFCWRQNKKANRKQHQARLHKIAVIAGRESRRRHQEHRSTPIRDNIPPYPPSVMYPGFSLLQGAPSYGCSLFSPFQGLPAPVAPNPVQLQQLQQLNAFGLGQWPPLPLPQRISRGSMSLAHPALARLVRLVPPPSLLFPVRSQHPVDQVTLFTTSPVMAPDPSVRQPLPWNDQTATLTRCPQRCRPSLIASKQKRMLKINSNY